MVLHCILGEVSVSSQEPPVLKEISIKIILVTVFYVFI